MSRPIDQALRTALLRHPQVALPGLGTFVRQAQSASFDGANRRLLPPGARLEFNGNLRADDGLLTAALQRQLRGDLTSAQAMVTQFVDQIKGQLLAGEAVDFQGLGKLRTQYGGGFEFTQTERALERTHQGLPSVAFTPIKRSTRQAEPVDPLAIGVAAPVLDPLGPAATLPPPPYSPPPRPENWSDRLPEKTWLTVVGILIVIGLFALYMLLTSILSNTVEEPKQPVRAERTATTTPRINQKSPATTTVPARTISPDEPPRLNAGRRNTGADDQGEAPDRVRDQFVAGAGAGRGGNSAADNRPTPSTGNQASTTRNLPVTGSMKKAVIITGLFGSAANVEKNLLRYRQAGYAPWSAPKGRYTQVGVEVAYSSERELGEALKKVRGQFAENAFVRPR